jgi:hypothetical protein
MAYESYEAFISRRYKEEDEKEGRNMLSWFKRKSKDFEMNIDFDLDVVPPGFVPEDTDFQELTINESFEVILERLDTIQNKIDILLDKT